MKSDFKIKINKALLNPLYVALVVGILVFWGVSSAQYTDITVNYNTPLAPSGLSIDGVPNSSHIYIKWIDNSENEDKFFIERKLSGTTAYVNIGQTNQNISYYDDSSSITPGASYDYRVKACLSGVGCSPYSNILEGVLVPASTSGGGETTTSLPDTNTTIIPVVPLAPTNLTLYTTLTSSFTSIPIKWTDNSDNEDKFKIERKLSSSNTFSPLAQVNQNIFYFVDSSSITPGVSYDYRVRACISEYCSEFTYLSNVVIPLATTTTTSSTNTTTTEPITTTSADVTTNTTETNTTIIPNTSEPISNTTIPIAPTELVLHTIPTISSTSLSLKWRDNSNNEDQFRIARKLSNDTFFIPLAQTTNAYFIDSTVVRGQHYDYRVFACLKDTCSYGAYLVNVFIPVSNTLELTSPTNTTSITTNTGTITNTTTSNNTTTEPVSSKISTSITPTSDPLPTSEISKSGTSNVDTRKLIDIISNETKDFSETERKKKEELVLKDTNKDGISDYDSVYVFKIDPVKPSPVSRHEDKEINAGEKVLLGFDPSVPELVMVNKEEPTKSVAPVVSAYKVDKIKITQEKKLIIQGEALPNSFVTLYIYSTPIIVVVKTDSNGGWQYTLDKELEDGDHTIYTATVNNSGNIVAKSSGYLFTKTAEAVTIKDFSITEAAINTKEPSLLEGINIYLLISLFLGAIIVVLVLIGMITKKNNPN